MEKNNELIVGEHLETPVDINFFISEIRDCICKEVIQNIDAIKNKENILK
ncbi:hypothetical protein [Chengkuizengella marina]|nr:hypothetical protein [Chengkuizengella marina]